MKNKKLGATGLMVSEVCLWTMIFGSQCDERPSFAIMDKASEWGVNFIDTANVFPISPRKKRLDARKRLWVVEQK